GRRDADGDVPRRARHPPRAADGGARCPAETHARAGDHDAPREGRRRVVLSRAATRAGVALLAALCIWARQARAHDLLRAGARSQAGDIEADAQLKNLTLRRDVIVTYGRYRMQADELRLSVTPGGIFVDGEGRVAFCPCADPPVAIAFSGGRVAPPGD